MTTTTRPLPVPTDLTRPFWESAAAGRLVIQHCNRCGKPQFFPRIYCISCMASDVTWRECSGFGTVYTFTINRRGANPFMQERVPYVVAMIDLDEGVRLMSNIIDSPIEQVAIGSRVRVVFDKASETLALPQFVLCDAQAHEGKP